MQSLTRRTTLSALAMAPMGLAACRAGAAPEMPPVAASGSGGPADVTAAVATAARAFLARTFAPGLAIGITGPAGRQLFTFGTRDPAAGLPVQDDTLFELGSISKTYTVALAAIAVQDGAMRWDDPPARHVPEVRGAGTDRLTALHLATHCTGGMPLQFPDGVTDWPTTAAWFQTWRPTAEPGTVRSYANPSVGLLGVMAARALGGDFATLVRERILAPLGLRDTVHELGDREMPRMAWGHRRGDGGVPVRLDMGALGVQAYGVRASVSDVLAFVEAHLGLRSGPAPVLSALAATRLGHYRTPPFVQAGIWEWFEAPAAPATVLEGISERVVFELNPAEPLVPPQAPPPGAYVHKTGATGGFGGYAAFWPTQRTGLVILANRGHATAERLALAEQLRPVMERFAG